MMHPDTESKIQKFLEDIKRKVRYYEKELDYARQSSWGSFSKEKGNYRWLREYLDRLMGLRDTPSETETDFFNKATVLCRTLSGDTDYSPPSGARAYVEKILQTHAYRQ